jgi:hypothetical protein
MLLSFLALLIALVAPALIGGVTRFMLAGTTPHVATSVAAVAGIATLCVEAWLVVVWVGRVFARGES